MAGASCLNVSRILPNIESSRLVKPVILPPGRAKLSTNPKPTGSICPGSTMGTERESCTSTGTTRPPTVTTTSEFDATRLAALARTRSILSVVQRSSNCTLTPSVQPSSRQLVPQGAHASLEFSVTIGIRHEDADAPHPLALLRPRRKWPRRCAAHQRDEGAARHSITSSARPDSGSGTVSPSALAVLRLMMSVYLSAR